MQSHKKKRNENREDAEKDPQGRTLGPGPLKRSKQKSQENHVNEVASKDIGPKTNGKGEQARRSGNELHGKQENRKQPIAECFGGTGKRQQIVPHAMMPYALPIKIEEDKNSTGKGHDRIRCRRRKLRENAEQVGEQDKDGYRAHKRNVLARPMADVLFEQISYAEAHGVREQQFRSLLHAARALDRKARAQHQRQDGSEKENHQGHNDVFRDGLLKIGRLDTERVEKPKGVRAQKM